MRGLKTYEEVRQNAINSIVRKFSKTRNIESFKLALEAIICDYMRENPTYTSGQCRAALHKLCPGYKNDRVFWHFFPIIYEKVCRDLNIEID